MSMSIEDHIKKYREENPLFNEKVLQDMRLQAQLMEGAVTAIMTFLMPKLKDLAHNLLSDPIFLNSAREIARAKVMEEFTRFLAERLQEE